MCESGCRGRKERTLKVKYILWKMIVYFYFSNRILKIEKRVLHKLRSHAFKKITISSCSIIAAHWTEALTKCCIVHSLYYYNDAVGHRVHGRKLFTHTIHTRITLNVIFFFYYNTAILKKLLPQLEY
jgi:hypothetical protein